LPNLDSFKKAPSVTNGLPCAADRLIRLSIIIISANYEMTFIDTSAFKKNFFPGIDFAILSLKNKPSYSDAIA
jgi:hypothetical protein